MKWSESKQGMAIRNRRRTAELAKMEGTEVPKNKIICKMCGKKKYGYSYLLSGQLINTEFCKSCYKKITERR